MILRSLSIAALFFALTGCEQNPSASASGCGANTALVGVRDGFLEVLCGCTETAGTVVTNGQTLSCTVSQNTWVVFDYSTTRLTHQIISTSTPSFVDSPVRQAGENESSLSHAVKFETTGTYTFQDRYFSGLKGQIVVQ